MQIYVLKSISQYLKNVRLVAVSSFTIDALLGAQFFLTAQHSFALMDPEKRTISRERTPHDFAEDDIYTAEE